MRRLVRSALVVGFLLAASCGWLMGKMAEQMHKQRALDDHVYKQDVGEVWKQLSDIGESVGCDMPSEPKIGETIDCVSGDDKHWIRMDARDGGHQVEIEVEVTRKDADGKETTSRERDWDLEWKLLERVDPDTAKKIQEEADAKGEKAKEATKNLEEALEENAN